jgi:putative oxidoreductase
MSGLSKLAAIGPTTDMIRAAGLPLLSLAFALAVVVELGGGLLLVAGFQARIVAAALALFSLAPRSHSTATLPTRTK